ncbi:hypothetical protein PG999_006274 [Apiospora kogelbergensis]|uniref:Secreted protein n=1 Tax=Apiospora kogelbergensis TaxID=1337665 RepID=A0AAW0QQB5_9PEZI
MPDWILGWSFLSLALKLWRAKDRVLERRLLSEQNSMICHGALIRVPIRRQCLKAELESIHAMSCLNVFPLK